ncbi:MAG TPA: hypothetical protein VEX13_07825, partial [Chloroflexia bacterium]|nr:hypothetical protein [Chloroflexia bacterium]
MTSIVLHKRGLFATLAIATILILGACDTQPAQPTATATTPPTSITQETPASSDALPTNTGAPIEQPTAAMVETPTTPAQPTATTAQAADEPLTLSPVAIETNDTTRSGAFSQERTLNLPPGFGVKVFATGLSGVRWLGLSPEGVVYATLQDAGRVVTLPDADKDGVADETKIFADGLPGVHGIAFKDGAVYVATEGEIIRLEDTDKDGA